MNTPSEATAKLVLACRGIHHGFDGKPVLFDINLRIAAGQIVSLVGPSGCGKSTLLRAILGTHPPLQGEVLSYADSSEGRAVRSPGRDRGIVYQRYALFPFLTARENVAIGPKLDETTYPSRIFGYPGWRKRRQRHLEEAGAMLCKLGLGESLDRYPRELSGGMRQRVAIAQALIMKPRLLLLDEPFGALDEATREDLQNLLLTLYQENLHAIQAGQPPPYTILIVTHELNEAIYVGDRVVGLSQYWDWRSAGHEHCPGATIIYDHVAPVYAPNQIKHYEAFVSQREEIRRVVFEPKIPASRDKHLIFWQQVAAGQAQGVLAAIVQQELRP